MKKTLNFFWVIFLLAGVLLGLIYISAVPLWAQELKSPELIYLEKELTDVNAKLAYIDESPTRYANEKIAEIEYWTEPYIDKDGKEQPSRLPDRQVKHEGNITMKQHLTNIKAGIQKSPGDYVTKEVTRLVNEKAKIDADLAVLKEVTDEEPITEK
jgi:hypothetical protein